MAVQRRHNYFYIAAVTYDFFENLRLLKHNLKIY